MAVIKSKTFTLDTSFVSDYQHSQYKALYTSNAGIVIDMAFNVTIPNGGGYTKVGKDNVLKNIRNGVVTSGHSYSQYNSMNMISDDGLLMASVEYLGYNDTRSRIMRATDTSWDSATTEYEFMYGTTGQSSHPYNSKFSSDGTKILISDGRTTLKYMHYNGSNWIDIETGLSSQTYMTDDGLKLLMVSLNAPNVEYKVRTYQQDGTFVNETLWASIPAQSTNTNNGATDISDSYRERVFYFDETFGIIRKQYFGKNLQVIKPGDTTVYAFEFDFYNRHISGYNFSWESLVHIKANYKGELDIITLYESDKSNLIKRTVKPNGDVLEDSVIEYINVPLLATGDDTNIEVENFAYSEATGLFAMLRNTSNNQIRLVNLKI